MNLLKTTRLKRYMQLAIVLTAFSLSAFLISGCGSDENKSEAPPAESSAPADDGKGIGPVKDMPLADVLDDAMAAEGKTLFEAKCTACHKIQKEKYVGPGLLGVSKRRKPEWIMNQILNPLEMTQKDPTAKELLIQFNMTQMTNQNVSQDDARKMLEYFRKNDSEIK